MFSPDLSFIPEGTGTDEPAGFGCSIATSVGWAIVGSCDADLRPNSTTEAIWRSAGAAYWVNLGTGRTHARLISPDPAPGARFGAASAAAFGHVVIGAPSQPGNGAAYVYEVVLDRGRRELRHIHTLTTAPAGVQPAQFGVSIALLPDETKAVIGARGGDDFNCPPLCDTGGAFVFNLQNGALVGRLRPLDANSGGGAVGCLHFGASVAASSLNLISPATSGTNAVSPVVGSEGYLLVGAPKASPPCSGAPGAGAAFLFDAVSLHQIAQLRPVTEGRRAGSEFGAAVAVHHADGGEGAADSVSWNDRAPLVLVGAPGVANGRGAVYTTVLNVSRVAPSDIGTRVVEAAPFHEYAEPMGPRFGRALALSRRRWTAGGGVRGRQLTGLPHRHLVLISSKSTTGTSSAVRLMHLPSGRIAHRLFSPEGVRSTDDYGISVALTEDNVAVVGSSGFGLHGAAFVFHPEHLRAPYPAVPPYPRPPPSPPSYPLPPPATPPLTPTVSPMSTVPYLVLVLLTSPCALVSVLFARVLWRRHRVKARMRHGARTVHVRVLLPTRELAIRGAEAGRQMGVRAAIATKDLSVRTAISSKELSVRAAISTKEMGIRAAISTKELGVRAAISTRDIGVRAANSTKEVSVKAINSTKQLCVRAAVSTKRQGVRLAVSTKQLVVFAHVEVKALTMKAAAAMSSRKPTTACVLAPSSANEAGFRSRVGVLPPPRPLPPEARAKVAEALRAKPALLTSVSADDAIVRMQKQTHGIAPEWSRTATKEEIKEATRSRDEARARMLKSMSTRQALLPDSCGYSSTLILGRATHPRVLPKRFQASSAEVDSADKDLTGQSTLAPPSPLSARLQSMVQQAQAHTSAGETTEGPNASQLPPRLEKLLLAANSRLEKQRSMNDVNFRSREARQPLDR